MPFLRKITLESYILWVGMAALLALSVLTSGCATTPVDVFEEAETTEQKAFALYGTFVVFEEQAATLVVDPTVDIEIRRALQEVDANLKPIADNTIEAALIVQDIRNTLDATEDDLAIALLNLNGWITRLTPHVQALVNIVTEAL